MNDANSELTPESRQILSRFIQDEKLRGLADRYVGNERTRLEVFLRFVGKSPQDITEDDLKRFLAHLQGDRQSSNGTIKNYSTALSSFFSYLEYERLIDNNVFPRFRRRYLSHITKKMNGIATRRQILSVEQMAQLVNSILDPEVKAIATLLAKTGIRVGELINIRVQDVDIAAGTIELRPTGKRAEQTIFIDDEAARCLTEWLDVRHLQAKPGEDALFTDYLGTAPRMEAIERRIAKYAARLGLHDPTTRDLSRRLTPHCFRHFFTTHLLRSGMPREYVKELRGDTRQETVDIYHHIDREDLRRSYLTHVPNFGI